MPDLNACPAWQRMQVHPRVCSRTRQQCGEEDVRVEADCHQTDAGIERWVAAHWQLIGPGEFMDADRPRKHRGVNELPCMDDGIACTAGMVG